MLNRKTTIQAAVGGPNIITHRMKNWSVLYRQGLPVGSTSEKPTTTLTRRSPTVKRGTVT